MVQLFQTMVILNSYYCIFRWRGKIKQAYNLTGKRIFGTLNKEEVELTQRLLKVGVVDSAVQYGETKRLIGDILTDPFTLKEDCMIDFQKK